MRGTAGKWFRRFLRFVPLMIGVTCIAVSVPMILHYLKAGSQFGESLGGFDILHDSESELRAFVGLVPISDSSDVSVTVSIEEWEASAGDCRELTIAWPGATFNHCYLTSTELPESAVITPEEYARLLPESIMHEFDPQDIGIYYDALLDSDYVWIDVGGAEDFCGAVNFIWRGGFRESKFSQVSLFLPFQTPLPRGTEFHTVKDYTVQLWSPNNCDLVWSAPQPTRFQAALNRPMYSFDVNVEQTDLIVIFNDTQAEMEKQQGLVLFSGLLGIGFAVTVEEGSRFLRHVGSKR